MNLLSKVLRCFRRLDDGGAAGFWVRGGIVGSGKAKKPLCSLQLCLQFGDTLAPLGRLVE